MKSMNAEMDEAIIELANAAEAHTRAATAISRARSDETTCLNRVNNAQKRLDELMGMLKKQAPRESDWHRASRPVQSMPASSRSNDG